MKISAIITLCLAAALLIPAGCSPKKVYKNRDLALDSAEAREVAAQLVVLKNGGAAGVESFLQAHAAADNPQAAMLRGVLAELAATDSVELRSVEQFGPEVLRVVVHARRGDAEAERAFLLVRKDGALLWVAPN